VSRAVSCGSTRSVHGRLTTLKFIIFSYNRGQFLEHCVASIERYAPDSPIAVYDDASQDPETCRVLEGIATRHTVVSSATIGRHKHGGLYGNMQAAYEDLSDEPLVCFLQDDMQLVRPLDADARAAIARYFDVTPNAAFLSVVFAKGPPRDIDPEEFRYAPDCGAYLPTHDRRSAGTYFADVCVFRPDRLRAVNWQFAAGEPANDRQARAHFAVMGLLRDPLAMWLPFGPTYRGRRRTWAIRLAERKHQCGFYPFAPLSDAQIAALKKRPDNRMPAAEQFLVTDPPHPAPHWLYSPLSGSRFYKKLNSLELFLRRSFGG
jgi:glycosyltransferase involved in cell wall biosynthesis